MVFDFLATVQSLWLKLWGDETRIVEEVTFLNFSF